MDFIRKTLGGLKASYRFCCINFNFLYLHVNAKSWRGEG